MPFLKNNSQTTEPWRQCFPPGTKLFALPDRNKPRLIAESLTPGQRWKDSRFFPAYRTSARFFRKFQRVMAAIHPNIINNGNSEGLVRSAIEKSGVHFDRMTVIVGTAGPRQKFSIRLLNNTDNITATVKLGFQEHARFLLNHEAEMLELIPANMGPMLQTILNTSTYTALILEHIPGHSLPTRLGVSSNKFTRDILPSGVLEFMDQFPSNDSVSIHSHPAIQRLMDFRSIPDSNLYALQCRNWPIVLQHGDFAPWNLISNDNRLRAIDWEDAVTDGFLFFDLIHYIIQVSGLIYHWSPEITRKQIMATLANRGLSIEQSSAMMRLGAIDAARRFQNDPPSSPLPTLRREIYNHSS